MQQRPCTTVSAMPPPTQAFALHAVQPNPSTGPFDVSFVLGSSAPAVLDVAGRHVMSREVGTMGPGAHVLRLSNAGNLRNGVYIVRLTQGSNSATAKAAVTR